MPYSNLFNFHKNDYMMLVYALLWTFAFIYSFKKSGFKIGTVLTLIYAVSSYIAIYFFYEVNNFGIESWTVDSGKFHLGAFFYLFISTMLFIWPVIKHSKFLSAVRISYKYSSTLWYALIIISPIIMWGFISIGYEAIKVDSVSLADTYESSIAGENSIANVNYLGKKCIVFISYFSLLWPILFFMCILGNSKYKKMAIIPGIAFLCSILTAYVCAARVGIVKNLMFMGIVYFLHRNNLDSSVRRKLKLFFFGGFALVIIVLTIITLSRFGDSNAGLNVVLTMYMGEGELRFAENVWNTSKYMNGDMCFSTFKDWLGFDTFLDLEDRRDFYNNTLGFTTSIFETFIGDLVLDLGHWGGFLVFIASSIFINLYLDRRTRKGIMEMDDIFWLSVLILTIAFGFTYLFWKISSVHLDIIRCAIVVYILKNKLNKQAKNEILSSSSY